MRKIPKTNEPEEKRSESAGKRKQKIRKYRKNDGQTSPLKEITQTERAIREKRIKTMKKTQKWGKHRKFIETAAVLYARPLLQLIPVVKRS